MCGRKVVGRLDKKFCSATCKAAFNRKKRAHNKTITKLIDSHLHKNLEILQDFLGTKNWAKTDRLYLDQQHFNWHYFTSLTRNHIGKIYYHIYDLRYMKFSDGGVAIYKSRPLQKPKTKI